MPKQNTEFNRMLEALMVSRTVVLSLMDQVGMHSFKEKELAEICRRCAMDLIRRGPSLACAIATPIQTKKIHNRRKKS